MNTQTENQITQSDWYEALIKECRAIIIESVSASRWVLVEGYWLLGKRIREDDDLKKWEQNKAGRVLQGLAKDINISTRTIHYALQAYDKYPDINTIPEGKNISWNKLITKYLPEPKIETPTLPEGKYNVIYADPPWDVKAGPGWSTSEESRDLTYPTMSLEEIEKMSVNDIASDNAWLFLWAINKYLEQSYSIARAWGFEPACLLTWCKKPHGIGLGGTFIQTTEHLLFARKGTLTAKDRINTTWFEYPRRKHSEKPHEIRTMIENVAPEGAKRIELFARKQTEGWDTWGNEV